MHSTVCEPSKTYLAAFILLWKSTRGRHRRPNRRAHVTLREKSQGPSWLGPHPSVSGGTFLPPPASPTWTLSYLDSLMSDTICKISASWLALPSKWMLISWYSCRFRKGGRLESLAYREVWRIFTRVLFPRVKHFTADCESPYECVARGDTPRRHFAFIALFVSFKKFKNVPLITVR